MADDKSTLVGVFQSVKWRSNDSDFLIGFLDDGTCIKGDAEEGSLEFGLTYQFFGKWIENDHGRQFAFDIFTIKDPHSRTGIIVYLEKYAPNIGTITAGKLYDHFAGEAVRVLRLTPDIAARAVNGNVAKFKEAAEALQLLARFEDVKIELTNLFAGRGFSGKCIEACVEKWGILAPARIKRDPFCLLVEKMPSAGFDRCNRLYLDLGLKKGRLKRLMICMWNAVRGDRTGNTWMPADLAVNRLKGSVSDVVIDQKKIRKTIKLGTRSRWLSLTKDANGNFWIAENDKAFAEKTMAEKLAELNGWTAPPNDGPDLLRRTRADACRAEFEKKRAVAIADAAEFSDL